MVTLSVDLFAVATQQSKVRIDLVYKRLTFIGYSICYIWGLVCGLCSYLDDNVHALLLEMP